MEGLRARPDSIEEVSAISSGLAEGARHPERTVRADHRDNRQTGNADPSASRTTPGVTEVYASLRNAYNLSA